MDTSVHDLNGLLSQLGLPSGSAALEAFLSTHHLDAGTSLVEASFWSASQAEFLREALADDSDWADAADALAVLLSA